ncbi:hypothetical protein ABW21_db0206331 [Orbilia brochopaga]|nr:hypothetical protein ABW21_db0206331 [Drechslerella brochopaga]
MRLSRLLLPAARPIASESRPRLLRLCLQPLRRHQSSAPSAYPSRFPHGLDAFYHPQYLSFYTKHLAGKPRYNPFDHDDGGFSRQYPCSQDYQRCSPVARNVVCEDVLLPRNATGSIILRIYNSDETTAQSPVILYLPSRGTNPIATTNEHHVIAYIAQLTRATVISVGYRISRPFPLSLHDALAALDWTRDRMRTVNLENYAENLSGRLVAVLGTGIGGSLALSVGLSEGRESGIIAAGAWAPIVDWAFDPLPGIPESPSSTLPRSIRRLSQHIEDYRDLGFGSDAHTTLESLRKLSRPQLKDMGLSHELLYTFSPLSDNPFLSTEDLKDLRSRYLATAEDFTDPFVSPLYWFSSSGVNIWTELLSIIEDERLANPEAPPKWLSSLESEFFERRPRNTKGFPPLDLIGKLSPPAMRVVNGDGDILHDQINQFVQAARHSMFPAKLKTMDELLKEEADDLIWQSKVDKLPSSLNSMGSVITENLSIDPEDPPVTSLELEPNDEGQLPAPTTTLTPVPLHADFFVQHDVKEKAGHCFVTAAGEIEDGVEEAQKMASWLLHMFALEPERASQWKAQKEGRRKAIEDLELQRRHRRLANRKN